jgi:hypothetical protein
VILESPAPDPKWGRAGGRAWGMYALIHAPELGGAFFFGVAVHGSQFTVHSSWFFSLLLRFRHTLLEFKLIFDKTCHLASRYLRHLMA